MGSRVGILRCPGVCNDLLVVLVMWVTICCCCTPVAGTALSSVVRHHHYLPPVGSDAADVLYPMPVNGSVVRLGRVFLVNVSRAADIVSHATRARGDDHSTQRSDVSQDVSSWLLVVSLVSAEDPLSPPPSLEVAFCSGTFPSSNLGTTVTFSSSTLANKNNLPSLSLCGVAETVWLTVSVTVPSTDGSGSRLVGEPQTIVVATIGPLHVRPGAPHHLELDRTTLTPWSVAYSDDTSALQMEWGVLLPELHLMWADTWENTIDLLADAQQDDQPLPVDWFFSLSLDCKISSPVAGGHNDVEATGVTTASAECWVGRACSGLHTRCTLITLVVPHHNHQCLDAVRALVVTSSSCAPHVVGELLARRSLNQSVSIPVQVTDVPNVLLPSSYFRLTRAGDDAHKHDARWELDAFLDGSSVSSGRYSRGVMAIPNDAVVNFVARPGSGDAEHQRTHLDQSKLRCVMTADTSNASRSMSEQHRVLVLSSNNATPTMFRWVVSAEDMAYLPCWMECTLTATSSHQTWWVTTALTGSSITSAAVPQQRMAGLHRNNQKALDVNSTTTTVAPTTTAVPPSTVASAPPATTTTTTTTSAPATVDCQSITSDAPLLQLTSDSTHGVNQIPLWFQDNARVFPLVVAQWSFPSSSATSASNTFVPSAARKWTLVPNPRYFDVPLGLLASFTFGASYCKVGRVTLALAKPICRNSSSSDSDNDYLWKQAAARFLDSMIVNVTSSAQQSTYATIDAVQPDVANCYSDSDAAAGNDITLWDLTCMNKQVTDPTTDTSSGSSSSSEYNNTSAVFTETSGTTPGLIVVIFLSIVVALGCGCGIFWYAWFTMSSLLQHKVKLTNRNLLPLAVKWRIVVAHILAPFCCIAHAYAIFPLRSTSVGDAFFGLDILFSIIFVAATILRLLLPRHRFTTPVYLGGVLSLLFYTCCVFGGSTLWALAALSIDVRVIPYATAGALVLLQAAWQVKLCGEQLAPSVSLISKTLRRTNRDDGNNVQANNFVQTVAPVNNALSLELFTIVMLLFMFAVTQVEDITPFMAVIAAFVMVAYSFLANYSITRQLEEALSGVLQNEDAEEFEALLAANDGDGKPRRPTSAAEAILTRLLSSSRLGGGSDGGSDDASPLQKELSRVARRMTRFDTSHNDSITSSRSGGADDDDGGIPMPNNHGGSGGGRSSSNRRGDVAVDFDDADLLGNPNTGGGHVPSAARGATRDKGKLKARTTETWDDDATGKNGAKAAGQRQPLLSRKSTEAGGGARQKQKLRFSSSSESEGDDVGPAQPPRRKTSKVTISDEVHHVVEGEDSRLDVALAEPLLLPAHEEGP